MRRSRLFESEEHDAGLAVTDTGKIEVFDLIARKLREDVTWIIRQQKHTFRAFLTYVIGNLGESLGESETDSARNPNPAQYLRPEPFTVGDILL